MKRGRRIKVPPEDRRVTSVPRPTVVSQLKFLTLSDNANNLADNFAHDFAVEVDIPLDLNDALNGFADSLAFATGVSADVADVFLFLDDFTIERGDRLGVSDSVSLSDALAVGKGVALDDSIVLSDATDLNLQYLSELADVFSLSDELLVGYGLATEDQFILADFLEVGISQPISDSMALSDSLSLTLGFPMALADTGSQSDSIALGYGLAPSDQIVLADSLATFGQIFLTIQDSIDTWDEFLHVIPQGVDYAIERSDDFTLTDSISLFSAGFKSFSESLSQTDAYAQRGDGLLAFSDQLTFADSIAKVIDCRIVIADDAANLNDAIALRGNGLISVAESINNLADSYAQRGNGLLTFSEQLIQTDGFSTVEGERKTLSDSSIQPSDGTAIAGSIWDITVTGEQLSQSDALSLNLDSAIRQIVVNDSFTLTDSVDVRRGPSRWNDAISVSTAVQNSLTQNLSDSLPTMLDDQVNKFIRWRDAISVVKVNAGALNLILSDTNTSMSDAISSAQVQFLRPTSDVSVGLWSTTPLFNKIDEGTVDDADLIVSATNPSNDTCEVALNAATDPVSSVNHILSYRYKKSANAGRQIDLTVRLVQGTTILATFTHTNISNTITQADQTLSGAQADSITNYGDLRIRFAANAVGTGTGRAGQITWAQFKCPK